MDSPFPRIPFQTQLDFLWSELEGPEKKTLEAFQSGSYVTPQDYAEAFEKLFERSKGSALDTRKQYALEVFKGMEDPLNPQGLSQNAAIAYNYLLNKGLNAPQASGIVGNLMAESFGSIDPAAYNPKGGGQGALGIAQWRGPRLESLLKFAGMNGEKPMVQSTFGSGVPTAGTIFPQQQKKQGLQGLLQQFMRPNETTGLTGAENFAQALDALILPEARMGEQIRARGAQRLLQQRKNATAEMLRRMPDGAAYANMIDQGMPAQEVYAQYMKDRREGVIGSSLSKDAFTNVRDINKDLASDFDVKVFQQAQQGFEALKYAFDNPSGVSDYALTIAFAKILDPASVVREGEQAAIAKSGGAIDSFLRQTENFFKGDGSLPEEVRRDIFNLAANNYTKYMERAQGRYSEAEQLLIARGIDPKFLRKLDFTDVANVQAQKPSEQTLGIPPVPEGSTINGQPMTMAQWISIWNSKTEEDRSYFLENGAFPS